MTKLSEKVIVPKGTTTSGNTFTIPSSGTYNITAGTTFTIPIYVNIDQTVLLALLKKNIISVDDLREAHKQVREMSGIAITEDTFFDKLEKVVDKNREEEFNGYIEEMLDE